MDGRGERVSRADVRWEYATAWWDGPIAGVAALRGERLRCDCVHEDAGGVRRVFQLFRMPEAWWAGQKTPTDGDCVVCRVSGFEGRKDLREQLCHPCDESVYAARAADGGVPVAWFEG